MRCVSVTLLLCLALMLLAQHSCQVRGLPTCLCLKTSDRVLRKENIENYTRQSAGICHIDAVLFKVKGRFVCSDPQKPWVKKAIEFVDNKKKAAKMITPPANSASTTTLNNTSDWNTTG